jgi:arylsulfatase A-like enzyme
MTGFDTARASKEPASRFKLEPEQVTMAQVLAAAGYETGFVGVWTLGATENLSRQKGMLESAAILPGEAGVPEYPASILKNGQEEPVAENAGGNQLHLTDLVAREAAGFLQRRQSGNPFFLLVVLKLPHGSQSAPSYQQFASLDWTDAQKAYAARISEFDRAAGMLMGQLQELNLAGRTTLIFTSDSGPRADEEGTLEFFNSTGGLRGHQGSLHEGGLRVPFVARSPGQFMTDVERDDPAVVWDLMPTFIEMSGAVRKPRTFDGVSIAPLMRGGIGNPRDMFYWENPEEAGLGQAVRMDKWKVVRPAGKTAREDCELYDVKKDPGEAKNVAKDHPDVVTRFLR